MALEYRLCPIFLYFDFKNLLYECAFNYCYEILGTGVFHMNLLLIIEYHGWVALSFFLLILLLFGFLGQERSNGLVFSVGTLLLLGLLVAINVQVASVVPNEVIEEESHKGEQAG